jgi:hypothetical protein
MYGAQFLKNPKRLQVDNEIPDFQVTLECLNMHRLIDEVMFTGFSHNRVLIIKYATSSIATSTPICLLLFFLLSPVSRAWLPLPLFRIWPRHSQTLQHNPNRMRCDWDGHASTKWPQENIPVVEH